MKVCTIISSDKGGVGKTEIAALLIAARDRLGGRPAAIEIDHQMKLKSVLGGRVDLSLRACAELTKVYSHQTSVGRHYDPVFDLWSSGESITDLGANVTTPFFEWARDCGIASLCRQDGIRHRFVSVASPDSQALRAAYSALREASAVFDPVELYFIENDTVGGSGFQPYVGTTAYRQIETLETSFGCTRIRIPNCKSKLVEFGRARSMTPLAVLDRIEAVENALRLTKVERAAERLIFLEWLSDVQTALAPLMMMES